MDESPFGKLAPELRNQIYELAVLNDVNEDIQPLERGEPALTKACKQTREEYLPIFYARAKRVSVTIYDGSTTRLIQWLKHRGNSNQDPRLLRITLDSHDNHGELFENKPTRYLRYIISTRGRSVSVLNHRRRDLTTALVTFLVDYTKIELIFGRTWLHKEMLWREWEPDYKLRRWFEHQFLTALRTTESKEVWIDELLVQKMVS